MQEALDDRLRDLERTLDNGRERLDDAEAHAAEQDRRLDELEAAVLALRGYVGNIRAVNREVERMAEEALARVETLESSEEASAD